MSSSSKRNLQRCTVILILVMSLCTFASTPADAVQVEEYALKAGFLWRFIQFSELAAPPPVFQVCVSGDDQIVTAFKVLERQELRGSEVQVRRVDSLSELEGCTGLFFSLKSRFTIADFLAMFPSSSILTVGEREGFASHGGIIGFFFEERQLRFEVNTRAAHAADIKISSRLLKLARLVNS